LTSAGSSPQNTSSEAPTHPPAHAATGSRQIRPFPVRGSDNDFMRQPPPALAAAAKTKQPQRNVRRRDWAEEAAAAVAACPTCLRSRPASTTRTATDGGDRERAAAREGGLVRAERGGWTAAAAPSSRGWGWRWGDSIGYRLGRFPSPAGLGVRKRVCGLGSGMGRAGPKQYPTGIKSRLMTRLMTWTL
jgi:hypothetical protein